MTENRIRILQVSTVDIGGGAEKVAWTLFKAYEALGYDSWLAAGRTYSHDAHVVEIPAPPQSAPWARLCWLLHGRFSRVAQLFPAAERICYWLRIIAQGTPAIKREIAKELGREDFDFPSTRDLLSLPPEKPDILHCHNLHGGYFDLRELPKLSRQIPTIITLHDEWLLTGHCAYTFTCNRWRAGCGSCPDISIYPGIRRDATAYNWQCKKKIYAGSRLHIAAPSKWLMERASQSMLAAAASEKRIIPYGVDLSLFCPENKKKARLALGLPLDVAIVLFVANRVRLNIFKDYGTIRRAVEIASQAGYPKKILFIALGDNEPGEQTGSVELRFIPYEKDARVIARYYQAADLYLHAAKADNFPNTILEALACGVPVIATAVGGITEQIADGVTGFLTAPGDSADMAHKITHLLNSPDMRLRMGHAAAADAKFRFNLDRQVADYAGWYAELLRQRPKQNA